MSRIILLLLIISLLLFSGCTKSPKPIKIGLSINLSGRGGTAGEYIRDGALLAVDEINNQGGINGQPLELIIKDDKNSEEEIIAADRALIEQGVITIIGHSFSQNTITAHPFVTSHNTLLFTPYTGTTKLSGQDDLFFRTSVDNTGYGKALASLLKKYEANNISCLLDMSNQSFGEDYLEQTKRYYPGKINTVRLNTKKEIDWDTTTRSLLRNKPDVVVLLTEVTATGMAAQKLRNDDFQGNLIATLWAQSPDLMRYGGKAVEDLKLITFVNPENNLPAYLAFAKKMEDQFNRPATAGSTRAYEAVQIISEALKKCPASPNSFNLKTVLLNSQFNTIMGPVKFDKYGDVLRPIYEITINNGRFNNLGEIVAEQ